MKLHFHTETRARKFAGKLRAVFEICERWFVAHMLVREIVRVDLIYTAEREREVCKQHHTARAGEEEEEQRALAQILSLRVHSQESNTLAHLKQKQRTAQMRCFFLWCSQQQKELSQVPSHVYFLLWHSDCMCARGSAWKIQTLTTSAWHSYRHRARSYFTEAGTSAYFN